PSGLARAPRAMRSTTRECNSSICRAEQSRLSTSSCPKSVVPMTSPFLLFSFVQASVPSTRPSPTWAIVMRADHHPYCASSASSRRPDVDKIAVLGDELIEALAGSRIVDPELVFDDADQRLSDVGLHPAGIATNINDGAIFDHGPNPVLGFA